MDVPSGHTANLVVTPSGQNDAQVPSSHFTAHQHPTVHGLGEQAGHHGVRRKLASGHLYAVWRRDQPWQPINVQMPSPVAILFNITTNLNGQTSRPQTTAPRMGRFLPPTRCPSPHSG